MKYTLDGKEIDLTMNASDNPSCPRCVQYNAMLSEYQKLRCRNCGCVVLEQEEPDVRARSQEMIANASDSAIRDAVSFLRHVHGQGFSTVTEAVAMDTDTGYARGVLHNTSYHGDLYAYFSGFCDGGAQGSAGLLRLAYGSNERLTV